MGEKILARPVAGGQESTSTNKHSSGEPLLDGSTSQTLTVPHTQPDLFAESFRFLDFLFAGVQDGRYLEFRYLKPGEGSGVAGPSSYFAFPLDHDEVTRQLARRNGRMGISYGAAPRFILPVKPAKASRNTDVIDVTAVWGDLDFKSVEAAEVYRRIRVSRSDLL